MSTKNIDLNLESSHKYLVSVTRTLNQIWHQATVPPATLTDSIERRRARLITGMLIVVFLVGMTIVVMRIVDNPSNVEDNDFLVLIGTVFSIIGLYILARRGFTNVAAGTLIAMMLALFVVVLDTVLYFAIIPVLLAAVFFSGWQVLLVATIAVVVPQIRLQFTNQLDASITFDTGQFIALASVVVLTYINHSRTLETIRRAELQDAYAQVKESEAMLEQRVIERTDELRKAKEEAEEARHKAEESDRVKSQFLASMSHELRTPLNAILTFTELIAMGTFGPVNDEQVDYLQKSLGSGKHLLSLINDVLDITKIHSGMMKLFIEDDFNVKQELQTITETAEQLAAGKPIKIVSDIDSDFPLLCCDKRRVRQVLLNLISNAVKFTEEGTITLSAKKRDDELLFAVIDTGPGIPEVEQDQIFEPFVQTETGIKHAGGTGLGLPISKQLIVAHGGQLWVESKPGEGAAFYAVIPVGAELILGETDIQSNTIDGWQ